MHTEIHGFRLSPQQKRLWLLQQGGKPLRATVALLLKGQLKKGCLNEALRLITHRHEMLRTVFHCQPGITVPIQVIAAESQPDWREVELREPGAEYQQARIEELFEEANEHEFNFERDAPLRATLVKLSAERHVLLLSLPSLYADAHTAGNLLREVSDAYGAIARGDTLSSDVVQYLQFSEWQNEILQDPDSDIGKAYWSDADLTELDESHLVFETMGAGGFEPRSIPIAIRANAAEIDAAAARFGASCEAFLFTCWQVLIYRHIGQSEIVAGASFSGRRFEELERSLGLFARCLPIGSRLNAGDRFRDLLGRTHSALLEAGDWQEYWDGTSGLEFGAKIPYLPLAFEYVTAPSEHAASGISFSILKQRTIWDRFKIKLTVTRRDGVLERGLQFDSSAFEARDIARLAAQFDALVDDAVLSPESELGRLGGISEEERRQFLIDLNRTRSEYPRDGSVHGLFEQQAIRTPGKIAVAFDEQLLSYAELNERSNQLAHYLRSLGAGPETVVAIFLDRSIEMVVALLGVLKTGAAYLPLDVAPQADRLKFMLEDSGARVIITKEPFLAQLPIDESAVICLDSQADTISEYSTSNPGIEVSPDNAAYVIYTSGSTGRPKGVVIPHRGVVNYLCWCSREYGVSEGEGAPVHSPIGFDLSVTAVFSPLVAGQKVVLIDEAKGIEGLTALLRRHCDMTFVKLTPSHLEALAQLLPLNAVDGATRQLIVGGEALHTDTVLFWRRHAPQTRIINEYGPTETVVGCSIYEVPPEGERPGATIPIGRPIANTKIYVLDSVHPVTTWKVGELFIGGDGLARGYANRPGLTAERFVPDPFSSEGGARLYRSGDLARFRADGNIEYVGRVDNQVKIRGFRVELGEIEALLREHPAVAEAVAAVREDVPGDRRLAVYVVRADGEAVESRELATYLGRRLPDYMVPSVFMALDAVPLTPNGKVDRRALPAPETVRPDQPAAYRAPQTELEETLTAIWQSVLNVQQVGINDNFFDLGGHSLLMVRMNRRIREALNIELSMVDMFRYPTIGALAKFLTNADSGGPSHEGRIKRGKSRKDSIAKQRQIRETRRAGQRRA